MIIIIKTMSIKKKLNSGGTPVVIVDCVEKRKKRKQRRVKGHWTLGATTKLFVTEEGGTQPTKPTTTRHQHFFSKNITKSGIPK